jgi:hypothetical protein
MTIYATYPRKYANLAEALTTEPDCVVFDANSEKLVNDIVGCDDKLSNYFVAELSCYLDRYQFSIETRPVVESQ